MENKLENMNGKQLVAYFKFNTEINDMLYKHTKWLPIESTISERVYCYMNNITKHSLCICNKPLIFHKLNKGYYKTCKDTKCVKQIRVNSINKTMIDTHGCHTSKLDTTKQKVKNTLELRYGDPNYVNITGREETMSELYGVKHALQSNKFLLHKQNTQELKYGDPNYVNSAKTKITNFKKRGVSNVAQDPLIKERIKESYNTRHLEELNTKLESLGITVISSVNNHYQYTCAEGHELSMSNSAFNVHVRSNTLPCNICNPYNPTFTSKGENELIEFIQSIYTGEIKQTYRRTKAKEFDIYIPELKIAFEYNGLYYHNELFKENDFHINKKKIAKLEGVDLIHIFEDDWIHNSEIVKSRITSILKKSERIYARKCIIKEVPLNVIRQFMDTNHLQHYVGSSIKLGLYYNGVLVSAMTFGKPRFDKKCDYELLRFCNILNTTVIGAAGKLFKYFINNYDVDSIWTAANRSWSVGDTTVYDNIGFNFLHNTQPGYWYVIGNTRAHRFNYRLSNLKRDGYYTPGKTAKQIMLDRKIYRIYDCGNSVYTWKRNH